MQGITQGLDINEYHSGPGLSASGVKLLLDCPARYYYEYFVNKAKKETAALNIGSAVHCLALEPELFNKQFIVLPDVDRRTKEGRKIYEDFAYSSIGKAVLSYKDFLLIEDMVKAVSANKIFQKIMGASKEKHIEDSIYFMYQDVLMKSRPDFYNDIMIVDLKTCEDASESGFRKQIFNYGYHIQAAIALDALNANSERKYEHFVLMAVEKTAPHLMACYSIDEESIQLGRELYRKAALLYNQCFEANHWPSYGDEIKSIRLPEWSFKDE